MGLRRIAAAPLYRVSDWIDDNPVSATGAVIALGALAALSVAVALDAGSGAEAGRFALDSGTATSLVAAASERPAYAAAALVGVAVALLYDG